MFPLLAFQRATRHEHGPPARPECPQAASAGTCLPSQRRRAPQQGTARGRSPHLSPPPHREQAQDLNPPGRGLLVGRLAPLEGGRDAVRPRLVKAAVEPAVARGHHHRPPIHSGGRKHRATLCVAGKGLQGDGCGGPALQLGLRPGRSPYRASAARSVAFSRLRRASPSDQGTGGAGRHALDGASELAPLRGKARVLNATNVDRG